MDPLSITSAIAGLVALVGTTVHLVGSFASKIRHRKETIEQFKSELESLSNSLVRLQCFLLDESVKSIAFGSSSVLLVGIRAIEKKLEVIRNKIYNASKGSVAALLWPLTEKDQEIAIQQIHNLLRWVHLALTADGCALLSKSSTEVSNILQNQLQEIDMLHSISERTINLENSLQNQTDMLRDERRQENISLGLQKLSSYDYEKKHRLIANARTPGTGSWLLKHQSFLKWTDCNLQGAKQGETTPRTLLCHGIAGAGKSILTSLVIDHLREILHPPQSAVIFTYFDYRENDNLSFSEVLRSLVKQLILLNHLCIESTFEHDRFDKLTDRQLTSITIDYMKTFPRCYLVVDAFDECKASYQPQFIDFFTRLRSSSAAYLLVTGRQFPKELESRNRMAMSIEIQAQSEDVRCYVLERLEQSSFREVMNEQLKLNIVRQMITISKGIFLLPKFQIQRLLQEPSIGDIEDSLYNIPDDLPTMFEDTLLRIQQQEPSRYKLALRVMAWVLYACRTLTLKELQHALAVRPGQKELQPKYKPSQEIILESCQGLIVLPDKFQSVSFVHYTVQQYLFSKSELLFPAIQEDLAQTCITYLSFTEFLKGPCSSEESILDRLMQFPFLGYSSRFWGGHASSGVARTETYDMIHSFLKSQPLLSNMSQMKYYEKGFQPQYWTAEEANSRNPLMVACNAGLEEIAMAHLDLGKTHINSRTVMGTTAIIQAAAVSSGNASLIRKLLRRGADPRLQNWFGNALHCAAEAGNCDTILELIETGMDPNIVSRLGRTALSCTADHDHHLAAGLLLDHGASLESAGWDSFLQEAVCSRASRIVGMLLERQLYDVGEILSMETRDFDI